MHAVQATSAASEPLAAGGAPRDKPVSSHTTAASATTKTPTGTARAPSATPSVTPAAREASSEDLPPLLPLRYLVRKEEPAPVFERTAEDDAFWSQMERADFRLRCPFCPSRPALRAHQSHWESHAEYHIPPIVLKANVAYAKIRKQKQRKNRSKSAAASALRATSGAAKKSAAAVVKHEPCEQLYDSDAVTSVKRRVRAQTAAVSKSSASHALASARAKDSGKRGASAARSSSPSNNEAAARNRRSREQGEPASKRSNARRSTVGASDTATTATLSEATASAVLASLPKLIASAVTTAMDDALQTSGLQTAPAAHRLSALRQAYGYAPALGLPPGSGSASLARAGGGSTGVESRTVKYAELRQMMHTVDGIRMQLQHLLEEAAPNVA